MIAAAKKDGNFLLVLSYLMTLLNSYLSLHFFQLILMGFFRRYFLKILNFFFCFPISKGHTPYFCSSSYYLAFHFLNNVKSQIHFFFNPSAHMFLSSLSHPTNVLTLPAVWDRLLLAPSDICLLNKSFLSLFFKH